MVGEAIQKDVEGEGRGVGGGRKECRWRKEERCVERGCCWGVVNRGGRRGGKIEDSEFKNVSRKSASRRGRRVGCY